MDDVCGSREAFAELYSLWQGLKSAAYPSGAPTSGHCASLLDTKLWASEVPE